MPSGGVSTNLKSLSAVPTQHLLTFSNNNMMPTTPTVASMLAFGAFMCSATSVYAEDHAGHNHHELEPCGCAAAEDGWKIDCAKIEAVEAAYQELIDDGCSASEAACDADAHCQSNYRIVQAHHDHCAPDTLPTAMELAFHDYEATCSEAGCVIGRQFVDGAAACPTVDCKDQAAMTAAVDALVGCDADCTTSTCTDAFKKVHAFHDTCDEEDLVDTIESGLHKYEDTCASTSACNTVSEAFDANECTEDHVVSDGGAHTAEKPGFEWVAVFSVSGASNTWLMQKVDGAYADETMRLVLIPTTTTTTTEEHMESLEDAGSALIKGSACAVIEDGETMTPAATGSCFELHVGSGDDSTFTINTTGIAGLVVLAQHLPTEFENDRHFFYDASNVDIEAIAQESAEDHEGHDHGGHDDEKADTTVAPGAASSAVMVVAGQALVVATTAIWML